VLHCRPNTYFKREKCLKVQNPSSPLTLSLRVNFLIVALNVIVLSFVSGCQMNTLPYLLEIHFFR